MEKKDLNKHGLPKAHPSMKNIDNPVVFFDISIANQLSERVVFELYEDVCPLTCQNFLKFCTGEVIRNNIRLGYKNSLVHRVIKGFCVQGGDFLNGDGTGATNIFSSTHFDDENFTLQHDAAGLLSMANSGPNTNGCQWFITLAPTETLNNKNVVFGRVLSGMLTVRKMEEVPTTTHNQKPRLEIKIVQCGEL